ncbi:hypothetical protein J649_3804 [Acinetobacter baumannii 1064293_45]|nr:hypothetical protein J462_3864 [Acinetobacter baumannii 972082]EXG90004.1 hypothetical protein J649_3804 [Acinetobacter baumannii 1064293_45]
MPITWISSFRNRLSSHPNKKARLLRAFLFIQAMSYWQSGQHL